jgi:hypothetical protein
LADPGDVVVAARCEARRGREYGRLESDPLLCQPCQRLACVQAQSDDFIYVTYSGDRFGAVDEVMQASDRQGQSVADFEALKAKIGNETIFKDSLSLFDDLEFVRFESKKAAAAIKEMRARLFNVAGRALSRGGFPLMMEGFEEASGAIVTIEGNGTRPDITVAAAILFDAPWGFAWIEPGYVSGEDYGSGFAHRIECTIEKTAEGFEFSGPFFYGSIRRSAGEAAIERAHDEWKRRGTSLDRKSVV